MKLQRNIFLLLLVSMGVFLGSCTIAKISGRGSIPLIMNQPQAKVQVIRDIQTSKQILFDYTGAFDVSEVLRQSFSGSNADAMINLNITLKTTPLDWLLNLVTIGIANAKTFEISGQLVKAPQGLGSISVPGSETLAESSNLNDFVPVMLQGSQGDASANMIIRVEKEGKASYKLVHYPVETQIP